MTLREWRSLWRFDHQVNIPELSITMMCPYLFVRLMWYTTSKEFRGWPNTLDSGVVIGWRWPFTKKFKEKSWLKKQKMAIVIYPAMDAIYTARVAVEGLCWDEENLGLKKHEVGREIVREPATIARLAQIAATFRKMRDVQSPCGHAYWSADCPDCARRSFNFAVQMVEKYEPFRPPDPTEHPLAAFQRREAEARKRLGVSNG